jgi:hypothetical protein
VPFPLSVVVTLLLDWLVGDLRTLRSIVREKNGEGMLI